jgi:predicted nucleic acid-binding protein
MIVVSDSSPLIALASIGRFDLLERLCGRLFVPPAVFREVVSEGAGRPGAEEVRLSSWIQTVAVQDPARHREINDLLSTRRDLGPGEVETIVLGSELVADWVLLDEAVGRHLAQERGLKPVGTIALLVAFHTKGWIPDVVADAEQLKDGGFWVSRRLLEQLRRRYGS